MDWVEKTNLYLESIRTKPFEWGEHDCIRFADQIIYCKTNKKIFEDWYGSYTTDFGCLYHYRKTLNETGFKDFEEALNSRLRRGEGMMPNRYSIIGRKSYNGATGLILGVNLGKQHAFIGFDGLEFLEPSTGDIEWIVE